MASRIKSFFGGRTFKEKQAEREAKQAQAVSAREAEEEGQRVRAERAASGRLMRGAGRRMLTFQGTNNLSATMGG